MWVLFLIWLCFPGALPLNQVTEHLHMSGDCTCGSYAKDGELDEIAFFYPRVAAVLRGLEREAEAAGIPACKWGQRPPAHTSRRGRSGRAGRLCATCTIPGQQDLLAHWRETGLITTEEYDTLTRRAA